mgnify:CR=1 FL=1
MNILNNNFASIESMREQLMQQVPKKTSGSNEQKQEASFDQILAGKQQQMSTQLESGLKFSKHANERLAKRNIDLSKDQVARLEYGTNKAKKIIKSINARGEEQSIPCNMINCFCMYSDYVPLTLDEWIELYKSGVILQNRKLKCHSSVS